MILHSKPTDSRGGIGFSTNFSKKGVDTPIEEEKKEEEEEFIKEEEFKV
jgi:hypothetical protein